MEQIHSTLKEIITDAPEDIGLTPQLAAQLLENDIDDIETFEVKYIGIPNQPHYLQLSHSIEEWWDTKNVDFLCMRSIHGINEDKSNLEKLSNFTALLPNYFDDWNTSSSEDRKQKLLNFLKDLGERLILTLLRMRTTVGSVNHLPPSKEKLIQSFQQPHTTTRPNVKLSTGARALCKHAHRASDNFWGEMKGGEPKKNEEALAVVNRLINEAIWMNVHYLPHNLSIFEIRVEAGYGARWSIDGEFFRGFLEPQMEDGHAIGWRH